MDYKESGVDIDLADQFVEGLKKKLFSTYNERVKEGVGGFAALYDMQDGRYLAAGTDGVGTKLKVAQLLNKHDTIGIDLVAMCVNDVICTGARPLFFLDYMAIGKLQLEVSNALIEGMVKGCRVSKMALIGGETAEMPGVYGENEYDLAGFCVGEVFEKNLLDGKKFCDGDLLLGIGSSGFHSNGYSLIRKVISSEERALLEEVLTPTFIYTSLVEECRPYIKGLAHITGGGFDNIERMSANFHYHITNTPPLKEVAPIFSKIIPRFSSLSQEQLYKTFNMGIGLVMVIEASSLSLVRDICFKNDYRSFVLGHIQKKSS